MATSPGSSSPLARLFPRPRAIEGFDPSERSNATVEVSIDPSLPPQGYELRVDGAGARLTHADDAGRRYGLQTVEQLQHHDGSLPHIHVRDRPDIATRGYMLDVSRDRVPTRATLARLVEVLDRCRYNHLELYIEHTFAYVDHEAVWADASPITADDLAWLDDRCAEVGIELVANQNCFGHLAPWLALDAYRDRAECPDGLEVVPGFRLPASVLAPTPENAELAVALVREQLAAVRSRRVNIGCDETFELGRGVSKPRADKIGVAAVYAEHLARIAGPLLDDGCSVLFWGDVLRSHPKELARLPSGDLTPVVWTYDAPDAPRPDIAPEAQKLLDTMGVDLRGADFETHLAPFTKAGTACWVAPGTSTWNSLVGRLENAKGNLLDAATAATRTGVHGILVTDWGDGGHHQPPAVSLAPIAYGGAVAWCATTNRDLDVAAAVDILVHDPSHTIGRVLESIGGVCTRTGVTAANASPLVATLFLHQRMLRSGRPDPDAMLDVLATLEQASADLGHAGPRTTDGSIIVEELLVATALARHAAERMAIRAGALEPDPARQQAELSDLIDRYRAAWLARSRPGGLERSVSHLERVRAAYDDA
jgi:hypothetical protein